MEAEKQEAGAVQKSFLLEAKTEKKNYTFYLINGLPIKGKIISFDRYTILIEKENKKLLIFKHAISTIAE